MKPHKPTYSPAKSRARVKMMIQAHLQWLQGYPQGDGTQWLWFVPNAMDAEHESFILNAKRISKATRVIKELIREYPEALPAVVGDSQRWAALLNSRLESIKPLLQCQPSPDVPLIDATTPNQKQPSDLYRALQWIYQDSESKRQQAIRVAGQLNATEQNHTLLDCCRICLLVMDEPIKTSGLIKLYQRPGDQNVLTEFQGKQTHKLLNRAYLKNRKKNTKAYDDITFPQSTLPQHLAELVNQLRHLKPSHRRRALNLIQTIQLEPLIANWHQWWSQVLPTIGKMCRIIDHGDDNKADDYDKLRKSLANLLKTRPVAFDPKSTFKAIIQLSRHREISSPLRRFFSAMTHPWMKGTLPHPIVLCAYFDGVVTHHSDTGKDMAGFFQYTAQLLNTQQHKVHLLPWAFDQHNKWHGLDILVFKSLKSNETEPLFNALNQLLTKADAKISQDSIESMIELLRAGYSQSDLISLILKLNQEQVQEIPGWLAAIAADHSLTEQQVIDLTIRHFDYDLFSPSSSFQFILRAFAMLDELPTFFVWSHNMDEKQFYRECAKLQLVSSIAEGQIKSILDQPSQHTQDWLNDYPQDFHKLLLRLHRLTIKAPHKARLIFKKTWWPLSLLNKELSQLTTINQTPVIQKRIQHLKQKLKTHTQPTQQQTQKIKHQLQRLIAQTIINYLEVLAISVATKTWSQKLTVDADKLPAWIFDSDYTYAIRAALTLSDHDLTMALHVLKHRMEPGPWHYLHHRPNQAFVDKMNHQGINMELWLNGINPLSYQATSGETITIHIENDPLELLKMGNHFHTCLSPGNFNYFSVFANIIDVNKQVIYARNTAGQVMGRTLIAMTQVGGVKTFYQYSHHKDHDFSDNVTDYIQQLTRQINATLVNSGQIDQLASTNWYDDGAIAVDHDIPCLMPDSDFIKSLNNISPQHFIPALTQALESRPLDALIFSILMGLNEFDNRPDFLPALLHLSKALQQIHLDDIIKLYRLALSMRQGPMIYEAHRSVIQHHLEKGIKNNWLDRSMLTNMVSDHPREVLNILRRFGREFNRRWQHGLEQSELDIAAQALIALGRVKQAQELTSIKQ